MLNDSHVSEYTTGRLFLNDINSQHRKHKTAHMTIIKSFLKRLIISYIDIKIGNQQIDQSYASMFILIFRTNNLT